jgi:hypothetical protein
VGFERKDQPHRTPRRRGVRPAVRVPHDGGFVPQHRGGELPQRSGWSKRTEGANLAWWSWTTHRFTPPGWFESARVSGKRRGLYCTGCQPSLPATESDRGSVEEAQGLSDAQALLRLSGRVEGGCFACPASARSCGDSMFTWRYLVGSRATLAPLPTQLLASCQGIRVQRRSGGRCRRLCTTIY